MKRPLAEAWRIGFSPVGGEKRRLVKTKQGCRVEDHSQMIWAKTGFNPGRSQNYLQEIQDGNLVIIPWLIEQNRSSDSLGSRQVFRV